MFFTTGEKSSLDSVGFELAGRSTEERPAESLTQFL
jgi:hypothetical protein